MFVGITFLVQAGTLVSLISNRNRTLLNYDACTNEMLLIEYLHMHEQSPLSMKLFNYGPVSIPIPRLREKIEFKILQYFFIRSYRLPFEFKYANYMCMVLRNYVIALVEVRPITWFLVAVFVALNYARIRVIDPLFQADVCLSYATENHANILNALEGSAAFDSSDLSSTSSALHRLGRVLSSSVSATYANHVCEEYTLRVSFVLCGMTTLYLLGVFVASEIYIQKLIDRVLDVEEIFAYYDETTGMDGAGGAAVDLQQQRSSVLKMNSTQQQQMLHQIARKRASSSAGVEDLALLPSASQSFHHGAASGTATPRGRPTVMPPHRNDSITQSQYPSTSVTTPQKPRLQRIPTAQNLTPLETGEGMTTLTGNVDDEIASPEPAPKEFKPLLLSQYATKRNSLGRNSFKVLEERKSLAQEDIQNLRDILEKSHSKRFEESPIAAQDSAIGGDGPLAVTTTTTTGRNRGNSFLGTAGNSGKFGPFRGPSFGTANNNNASDYGLTRAPSVSSAPLPDISVLRREFSADVRSSFTIADIVPNSNNNNGGGNNNKIRIFGKSRRYLYLKCLDRIMQEEYFEHARAAKRASVSLDTSIAANVIANSSTNALNSLWSQSRDRVGSTAVASSPTLPSMPVDAANSVVVEHQASSLTLKEDSPSTSPGGAPIASSGSTLQRLFRTESPTPPLTSTGM